MTDLVLLADRDRIHMLYRPGFLPSPVIGAIIERSLQRQFIDEHEVPVLL